VRRAPLAHLLLRGRDGAARRRLLDPDPPPRAALPADGAPAAERDPRRVGAAPRSARRVAADGRGGRTLSSLASPRASVRRAAALARRLLRVARPAGVRRRASPSVVV